MKYLVFATCISLGLVGCSPPAETSTPAVEDVGSAEEPGRVSAEEFSKDASLRALNATVADFARTLMEEDLDGFMSLFTEEAIRLPPDAPSVQGTDAIRASMYRQFENVDQIITIRMDESEFSGDLAFVRGSFGVTQTNEDGSIGEFVGSWMNLMRRGADGRWRIARNMWNRDQPPA